MRFLAGIHELPEPEIMHFTHVDYDREMAFVVLGRTDTGTEEILGVARTCAIPRRNRGVRSSGAVGREGQGNRLIPDGQAHSLQPGEGHPEAVGQCVE